jgi:hypothetical protein
MAVAAPRVVDYRVWGYFDMELADHMLELVEREFVRDAGPYVAFHDWSEMTGYETRARLRLTAWVIKHRERFEGRPVRAPALSGRPARCHPERGGARLPGHSFGEEQPATSAEHHPASAVAEVRGDPDENKARSLGKASAAHRALSPRVRGFKACERDPAAFR